MGDAIPAVSIITAAAAAAAVSGVAATLAPDAGVTRQPEGSPFVVIYVFLAVFSPVFITMLAIACLRLFHVPGAGEGAAPPERSHRGPRGLDAAAIAALPLLHYREVRRHRIVGADGGDALECSVCLLEFDDDDALRLLPMCPHVFHPECIGLWLERHATCPLCRASLLDAPAPQPQPQPQTRPLVAAAQPPDPSPDHPIVVLIGDREDEDDLSRIQCLARNRRAAGRQALPRSNSTGHDGVGVASNSRSMERFALLLPEHVRLEIIMSHRLRHVTSSVESVRVREDSAHGSSVGGSVRSAVARLLSRFAPGTGRKGDGGDGSVKAEDAGASSLHRWENSSRGAVGEEKRSV